MFLVHFIIGAIVLLLLAKFIIGFLWAVLANVSLLVVVIIVVIAFAHANDL